MPTQLLMNYLHLAMVNNKIRKQVVDNLSLECMTLFVDAYRLAISAKLFDAGWDEDQYTAHLCAYLNELKLLRQWSVSPQQPYYTDKHYKGREHPGKAPHPDIHFEKYVFSKQKPFEYTIEAKIIKHSDSHLKGRYINTGIENFKSKRYPYGCLAGYILEGSSENCSQGINSILIRRGQRAEILNRNRFIYNFNSTFVSKHLSENTILELNHIFLEFTAINA